MSQALTGIVMETYLQQEVLTVMPGSGQQVTGDRHMTRVRDHDHWIPGVILTILHVNNFSVTQ